jgi:3-isopropylmalate dehydrogenase
MTLTRRSPGAHADRDDATRAPAGARKEEQHTVTTPRQTTSTDHPGGRASVVTCLAGHGIGPEVTAAASRALAELSRSHGFRIAEVHPPFDTEAIAASGHPLPPATRRATRGADAILVAGADAPALEGVRAELELAVSVTRVLDAVGDSTLFAPLHEEAAGLAVERALQTARARSGRLVSVGVSDGWRDLVDARAEAHPGVEVVHAPLAEAVRALVHGGLGVTVVELPLAAALADAPRLGDRPRLVATAELGATGPGLFAPTHGTGHEAAGHGVADPTEMLLATALLLSEGLERRAAGEALEESLTVALTRPNLPLDAAGPGVTATTREFVDAVLALLPSARRDTEFALGVAR